MSINVRVFPSSSKNPYVANFYSGLEPKDVHVLDDSKGGKTPDTDVLHIQWPEAWMWSKHPETRKRNLKFILLSLLKRKSTGLKVVNTVHNLSPHKKQTIFQKLIYRYIIRNCDGFIHLSEAGQKLFFKKYRWAKRRENAVILHPSYKSQLTVKTKNEAREELAIDGGQLRIVFFGRILPYKGINNLIDAYLDSPFSMNSSLWIGGPSDEESTEQIASRISADCRIDFNPGFVDDSYLELQVKAADWVVLPYSGGLNSGVAVYALSCGTRAVVPDSPVMREMEGVTQSSSFKYFSTNNFKEVLDSVLRQGRLEEQTPDISLLDSKVIGAQYFDFLRSL